MTVRTHDIALVNLVQQLDRRLAPDAGTVEQLVRTGPMIQVHYMRRERAATVSAGLILSSRNDSAHPLMLVPGALRPTALTLRFTRLAPVPYASQLAAVLIEYIDRLCLFALATAPIPVQRSVCSAHVYTITLGACTVNPTMMGGTDTLISLPPIPPEHMFPLPPPSLCV